MRNYQVTAFARADLGGIWRQLAEDDSESTADRVIGRISDEFDKISEMPGIGHYREELLSRKYRFWRVWSYLVVYRWEVTPIEIVAVVHGARDLNEFFDDNPR